MTKSFSDLSASELAAFAKEAEIRGNPRYDHLNITPGSFIQEPGHHFWASKWRCVVICPCGKPVERATSDLWTFQGCEACKKQAGKAGKALKKLKPEELAKLQAMYDLLQKTKTDAGSDAGDEPKDEGQKVEDNAGAGVQG